MTLEELLESMPSHICKKGEHYHLFIAKGTRKKNHWIVGYSNYESELKTPIENKNLAIALSFLKMQIEEK